MPQLRQLKQLMPQLRQLKQLNQPLDTPGTDQFPVPVLSRILSMDLATAENPCAAVSESLLL